MEVIAEIAAEILAEVAGGLGYCLQIWLIMPIVSRTELNLACSSGNP